MKTAWLSLVVAALAAGAIGVACSSSEDPPPSGEIDAGDPGCCPDIQTGCTLRRYGKKSIPSDTCIVGNDGIVPDPSAPGWTRTVTADGCPAWTPPKGVPLYTCGTSVQDGGADTSVPEDAAADADSDASDAGDASTDATDDGG